MSTEAEDAQISPDDAQTSPNDLALDFDRLAAATVAEKGEIFLLSYLSLALKTLQRLPEDDVRELQPNVERTLLRIITAPSTTSSPCPKPGRPARALVARAFVVLFERAETRTLFDTLQALVRCINDVKVDRENRVASFYCAGEIMLAHGAQVMSMYAEIITVSLKIVRTSSLAVILRHAALHTLRKALITGGRSTNDILAKDILKALKGVLSDKAQAIQRAGAEALLVFYEVTPIPATLVDIESIVSLCIKAMDSADFATRRALSRVAAGLLASTQIEGSAPQVAPPKPKKQKEGAEAEDDDPYPTTTSAPAQEKAKTLLTCNEMLAQLAIPYLRPATLRRTRLGIIDIYATLFTALGTQYVESRYIDLFKHITEDLTAIPAAGPRSSRFEQLVNRKLVGVLLRDILGVRVLSEQGQIMALREIGGSLLKRWPALMPGQSAPTKAALVVGLGEVEGLLKQLGSAPQPVQDALYEPLVRLTGHPSRSVQVAAGRALREYCDAAPSRLASTVGTVLELLNKDLALLGQAVGTTGRPADIDQRTTGHALAVAFLLSVVPSRPLYASFDIPARAMSLAIQLLKQSGAHELHVSGVEIEVAWTLVAALMRLGPNFVRLHLPQLLILWKNALPKPTSKDASAAQVRTETEWAFLLHIREHTLTALLAFFRYNGSKLLNADIGRRIAAMLNNGLVFVNQFAQLQSSLLAEQAPSSSSSLNLVDRDLMLRRRLFQCCVALAQSPAAAETLQQSSLLTAALGVFADPERYTGSLVQAAIAASSGTFTSVWDATDGFGYGVTTLIDDTGLDLNRDLVERDLDATLHRPVQRAAEHDPLLSSSPAPPPATGVVDAAIQVFGVFFVSQPLQAQTALMQTLSGFVASNKTEKNPGRRMAILVNATAALSAALEQTMGQGSLASSRSGDNFAVPQLNSLMRDVIKLALLHQDARLRKLGSSALGRLAHVAGTSFMASQIQFCVSQVVSNTDPSGRAGCVMAFGEIYRHVGSLAAGSVLKTMVDVLFPLAADPHPLVHFWALDALASIIDSAGLSYSPYINATLALLARLYMGEAHEAEGGSPGSVNLRGDLPAYQAFCKIIDALIRVLGPELQESDNVRSLVLVLVREFVQETDEGVMVEATKALQHLVMFAPNAVDMPQLVTTLRAQLASSRQPLKVAAINGVYQLVQRDVERMSKLGGDRLVEELFALLDNDPSVEGVRDTITSWLKQTATNNPLAWVDLCQRIMSRSTAASQVTANPSANRAVGGISFTDEESQGIGLDQGATTAQPTSRWRTQLFALQCLHQVFVTLRSAGRREHFDATLTRKAPSRRGLLLTRVGDLIKMAFTASTAPVMDIRLEGVVVLRDVIENFGASQDLDFDEALLLEQFQAPIAAALTPAFAADSYPEVLASAIQVCAIFVGSGIVKEVGKMGRILRSLTSALESCKDSDMSVIGDLQDISSTAAVMLKTSIFAAWAELQVASSRQGYLVELIKPHLSLLCPFWVASLREYARVRTDPDASSGAGGMSGSSFESTYAGLTREVALPVCSGVGLLVGLSLTHAQYYEQSWSPMLHAVATLLKSASAPMLLAMDGVESLKDSKPRLGGEPALFFYVVFGLAFEALADPSGGITTSSNEQSGALHALRAAAALEAIEGLTTPKVAGEAILQNGLFDELCNLCYRLIAVETPVVQLRVVAVVLALANTYRSQLLASAINGAAHEASLADNKMMTCVRLVCSIIQRSLPSRTTRIEGSSVDARIALLRAAFIGLLDLADLHAPPLRSELYAVAFTFYAQLLNDESSPVDVTTPTLPVLKTLLERSLQARQPKEDLIPRVINGLLSASLQNVEDVRGRSSTAATIKKRGNLLAAVLVLTSLPTTVHVTQAAVEHCCFLISQLAVDDEELQATALHCAKTLILASGRGNGVLQYCVGQLLPGLANVLAKSAGTKREPSEPQYAATTEILKTFVGLYSMIAAEHRRSALAFFLPTFLLLISPSTSPSARENAAATSHLLQLAAQDSTAFREATAALEVNQKTALETAIRQSVGTSAPTAATSARPAIDLKMSFG